MLDPHQSIQYRIEVVGPSSLGYATCWNQGQRRLFPGDVLHRLPEHLQSL